MSFLAEIIVSLLEWLLSKGGVEVYDWIKAYRAKKAIIDQAKADAAQASSAKTPEEQDAALDKISHDTFH